MSFDALFTKIWTDAITTAASEGNAVARDLIRDPSKIKDMADVSNGISDIIQQAGGEQVAEAIFRDGFGIIIGIATGTVATTGSVPFIGPWAPAAGLVVGEAFQRAWNKAYDDTFGNPDYTPPPNPYGESIIIDDYGNARIDPKCSNDFNAAKNWTPPRDPLILDLDGNGIQTRAIDPAAPILFDHNADGIKTGTGWVGAGEGMVVLDLDGNGSIDSGRELFGDNTVITSGARAGQLAANGFEAIAQYDADADGAINSSDAIYSQLRIWQDGNADGISQSAELKTLAELGIASIGVAGQTDGSSLGGGNTQAQKGSFTRTDGSSGDSASVQFAASNFYREFTDDPALVQAAALQKARFVAGRTHSIAAIF